MSEDAIVIRKATKKDLPQLTLLFKQLHSHHKRFSGFELLKKDADKIWAKFALKSIMGSDGAVFVAEKDNELIGYALGLIEKNIPIYKVEKLGHFVDLFIRKEFRGRGVASRLKSEMFSWFRSKKLAAVKITAHAENRQAMSIYRNWKFREFHVQMRRKL